MRKTNRNNLIRVMLTAALLAACAFSLCACHVFAWYIPEQYSDEQKAQIYSFIKDELLTNLDHTIASVSFAQEGCAYTYDVFASDGKVVIRCSVYEDGSEEFHPMFRSVFYDGVLKEWNVDTRTETVTDKDVADYGFLFDEIRSTANHFKTDVLDVAPVSEDSYFHECFPWGMGMAQMYYEIEGQDVSAFWTVEKDDEVKNGLPLVFDVELYYGDKDKGVSLHVYGSSYDIDERIANIMDNYERDKEHDKTMLNKSLCIKVGSETLGLELYNTQAARELYDRVKRGDITISVDDYGGFEKVGDLGFSLTASDERITANAMDVMLYQGNKLVLFYGQNTWEYTKIGCVTGCSEEIFKDLIGKDNGAVQITVTAE